jgi:hypothetical protein
MPELDKFDKSLPDRNGGVNKNLRIFLSGWAKMEEQEFHHAPLVCMATLNLKWFKGIQQWAGILPPFKEWG